MADQSDPEASARAIGAAPLFTVIAPMKNEAENVAQLAAEIGDACAPLGPF